MDIKNMRSSQQGFKDEYSAGGVTYGYIRVSTVSQHDDRQRIAMEEFGIPEDRIFADKQSGKDFDRPAYMDIVDLLDTVEVLTFELHFLLGRNHTAGVVDATTYKGISGVYGTLRLNIYDEGNRLSGGRYDCTKQNIKSDGSFRITAILISVALDF